MIANNFTVSYGLLKSGLHSIKEDSTGFTNRSKEKRRNDVICRCWKVGMKTPLRLIGTCTDCFISPNYHSFPYKRIVHPCSSIRLRFFPKQVVSIPYNTDIELSHGPCTNNEVWAEVILAWVARCPSLSAVGPRKVLFLLPRPQNEKRLGAGPKSTHSQQNWVKNKSLLL